MTRFTINQSSTMKTQSNLVRFTRRVSLAAITLLAFAHFATGAPLDLSRLVVVGDSLMAGYQNGSLLGRQQTNGLAATIARQAGVPLATPLIAEPGIPNVLQLLSVDPLVMAREPGASTGRLDPLQQPFNLAVPGHTVGDALFKRPDFPFDSLTDLILGLPGLLGGVSKSQVEWAEALRPTVAVIWLGPNDTLGAALEADASLVTPANEFIANYAQMMRRMSEIG